MQSLLSATLTSARAARARHHCVKDSSAGRSSPPPAKRVRREVLTTSTNRGACNARPLLGVVVPPLQARACVGRRSLNHFRQERARRKIVSASTCSVTRAQSARGAKQSQLSAMLVSPRTARGPPAAAGRGRAQGSSQPPADAREERGSHHLYQRARLPRDPSTTTADGSARRSA